MSHAGMDPDPWQTDCLRSSSDRLLLLCSRQSGKSQTAAALAAHQALLVPESLVLIMSRTQRQSAELLRKVKELYQALRGGGRGQPWRPHSLRREVADYGSVLTGAQEAVSDAALSMEFANGSRVVSLPGNPDNLVGYSAVSLLIIDEAARTSDHLYKSVRPFLATSKGRLVALSTPFGKRGWFYDEWQRCVTARQQGAPPPWQQVSMTAADCPRISADFLEEERQAIGARWYRQEYECSFEDTVDAVFAHADIHRAVADCGGPLL